MSNHKYRKTVLSPVKPSVHFCLYCVRTKFNKFVVTNSVPFTIECVQDIPLLYLANSARSIILLVYLSVLFLFYYSFVTDLFWKTAAGVIGNTKDLAAIPE